MKNKYISIVAIASFLIVGCGEPKVEDTAGVSGNSYTCKSKDCNVEWSRSKIWIAKHSLFPITHADNNIIQTARSTSKSDSTKISFTATREDNRIVFDMYTENPFALNADTKYVPKAFFKYIATGIDPVNKSNAGYNIK